MTNITNLQELATEITSNERLNNKISSYAENLLEFVTEISSDENKIDILKNLGEKIKVKNESIIKEAQEKITEYTKEELLNETETYLDSINNPKTFGVLMDLLNNPEKLEVLNEKLSLVPN